METERQVLSALTMKIAEKIKNDPMEEMEACIYKVLKENILSFSRTHTIARNVIRDISAGQLTHIKKSTKHQNFSMIGTSIMEREDYSIIEEGVLNPYLDCETKTTVLVVKVKL